MSSTEKWKYAFMIVLFLSILAGACKKGVEGTGIPLPKDSMQIINKWIHDSMSRYYYWESAMPQVATLNENSRDFFLRLLNPEDKFSEISNGVSQVFAGTTFGLYGFQYIIFKHSSYSNTNLIGLITLVGNESSADRSGITRGMYFNKVDGQAITESNLNTVIKSLKSGHALKLTILENTTGGWKETSTKQLSKVYFEERPVYSTRVFSKQGRKTGYLFYNTFNDFFDADLFGAFASLKSKGVEEIIIDLRYNMGGSVAGAAKLCALLSRAQPGDVFGIFKGNKNYKEQIQSFQKAISVSSNPLGKDFAQITVNRISPTKIYILSSGITASAAELIINNLKPYSTIIHIGEKTFGKDVATIFIKDLKQPKTVFWEIQPVVFKLLNKLGEGNYSAGLTPLYSIQQYEHLPLTPLGSSDDPYIKQALELIYGDNAVSVEILKQIKPDKTFEKKMMRIEKLFFDSMKEQSDFKKELPQIAL